MGTGAGAAVHAWQQWQRCMHGGSVTGAAAPTACQLCAAAAVMQTVVSMVTALCVHKNSHQLLLQRCHQVYNTYAGQDVQQGVAASKGWKPPPQHGVYDVAALRSIARQMLAALDHLHSCVRLLWWQRQRCVLARVLVSCCCSSTVHACSCLRCCRGCSCHIARLCCACIPLLLAWPPGVALLTWMCRATTCCWTSHSAA